MALGKNVQILDSDDFVKGYTTSSNLVDGGISPESDCINLIANPGVLYPSNTATTIGSISGNVVASCYDTSSTNASGNPVQRFLITDTPVLYSIVNGILHSLGVPTFVIAEGLSDLMMFNSTDSPSDPILVFTNTSGLTHVSYNYASNALSSGYVTHTPTGWTTSSPHPMCIFNKLLFYADGPYLHTWDGSSYVDQVLTLQADQVITAINIDPGTGNLMLGISARQYLQIGDYTTTYQSPQFIGLYNGTDPTQLNRKVPVDGTVTALQNCGGYMYVAYGNCIGTWNGNGITFLRRIPQNGNLGSQYQNIYKNKICNFDNFLLYISNNEVPNPYLTLGAPNKIIAYGEVQKGTPAFFPLVSLPGPGSSSGKGIDFVSNIYQGQILYSYNNVLYSLFIPSSTSVFNTGDASPIYVSMRYSFQRPCVIDQVRIFYEDPVTGTGSTLGNLSVISDNRTVSWTEPVSSISGGATMAWFDKFPAVKTTEFQIMYRWLETSSVHGIQKIMVFYTQVE